MQLPANDMYNTTLQELTASMDVAMGGRVAEEMIYGQDHITAGGMCRAGAME